MKWGSECSQAQAFPQAARGFVRAWGTRRISVVVAGRGARRGRGACGRTAPSRMRVWTSAGRRERRENGFGGKRTASRASGDINTSLLTQQFGRDPGRWHRAHRSKNVKTCPMTLLLVCPMKSKAQKSKEIIGQSGRAPMKTACATGLWACNQAFAPESHRPWALVLSWRGASEKGRAPIGRARSPTATRTRSGPSYLTRSTGTASEKAAAACAGWQNVASTWVCPRSARSGRPWLKGLLCSLLCSAQSSYGGSTRFGA